LALLRAKGENSVAVKARNKSIPEVATAKRQEGAGCRLSFFMNVSPQQCVQAAHTFRLIFVPIIHTFAIPPTTANARSLPSLLQRAVGRARQAFVVCPGLSCEQTGLAGNVALTTLDKLKPVFVVAELEATNLR
jgi:hypothetical protein